MMVVAENNGKRVFKKSPVSIPRSRALCMANHSYLVAQHISLIMLSRR